MKLLLATLALVIAPLTASAMSLEYDGIVTASSEALPDNFSLDFIYGGQAIKAGEDAFVTEADHATAANLSGLKTAGLVNLKFQFWGSEAAFTNRALYFADGIVFDNKVNDVGDMHFSTWAGGVMDLKFCTLGSAGDATTTSCINNTGVASGAAATSNLGISELYSVNGGTNNAALFFFGDGANDNDMDDLVVSVEIVSAVPLPASGLMILGGLGLMGLRRKRK